MTLDDLSRWWVANSTGSIDIQPFDPASIVLLVPILAFLAGRGKRGGYLVCFSIFFFYVWAAASYTIFPLPTNRLPIVCSAEVWSLNINLIPSIFRGQFHPMDLNVYGNFLLGLPFGFGLPFITTLPRKRIILSALAVAITLELIQALSGFVAGCPHRSCDIDDVLLVFAGATAGHALLFAVARLYRHLDWTVGARIAGWNHIHAVLSRVSTNSSTA